MTVIVTDRGFGPDNWRGEFTALAEAGPDAVALDLPADTDPASLAGRLAGVAMIRVDFPVFSDGRGFSIARQLRLMGYAARQPPADWLYRADWRAHDYQARLRG